MFKKALSKNSPWQVIITFATLSTFTVSCTQANPTGEPGHKTAESNTAESRPAPGSSRTHVSAPFVKVDKSNGSSTVKAPFVKVEEGPDRQRTRVKAPFVNIDKDRTGKKVHIRVPFVKIDVDDDEGRVKVRAPLTNIDKAR